MEIWQEGLFANTIPETDRRILSPRQAFLFRRGLVKSGFSLRSRLLKWCRHVCVIFHNSSDGLNYTHATTFREFYIWVSVHHKSIIYNKPTRCNSGSVVFINNYKCTDPVSRHWRTHWPIIFLEGAAPLCRSSPNFWQNSGRTDTIDLLNTNCSTQNMRCCTDQRSVFHWIQVHTEPNHRCQRSLPQPTQALLPNQNG